MSKIHFISTNLGLSIAERDEFAANVEQTLRDLGRPNDAVIVLDNASWHGCVDMYDEGAQQ